MINGTNRRNSLCNAFYGSGFVFCTPTQSGRTLRPVTWSAWRPASLFMCTAVITMMPALFTHTGRQPAVIEFLTTRWRSFWSVNTDMPSIYASQAWRQRIKWRRSVTAPGQIVLLNGHTDSYCVVVPVTSSVRFRSAECRHESGN